MTVNPGWGGQSWIPASNDRIADLRSILPGDVPIQVDGGVGPETAGPATAAGAGLLVAGSSVFGADDPATAYTELVAAAQAV
jgi:ribulose-phosphate 3-epimerase